MGGTHCLHDYFQSEKYIFVSQTPFSDPLSFFCRGGKDKSPVAIADLVLLYNKAQEGIAKNDRLGFDIFNGIADVKAQWLKYCKPYEKRLDLLVATFRTIPVVEDESTDVMVPGFIVDPKIKGSKRIGSIKVNLQFLQNHKDLYMELHRDFTKIEYAPQSEAQLQNFKTLLLLEISLLMGSDLEWATGGAGGAGAASEGAGGAAVASEVLGSGGAGDDDEMSDTAPLFAGAPAGGGSGPAVAAGAGAGGGAVPDDPAGAGAGPADPAGVGAANGAGAAGAGAGGGAEDDDVHVMDVNDFTTWDLETFALVPFDKILFPTDPYTSICSVLGNANMASQV